MPKRIRLAALDSVPVPEPLSDVSSFEEFFEAQRPTLFDARGNIIYAAADYQTVTTLARILQRAGAVRAMQFDINPEWPSLITYSHRHGLDPTKVVPNVKGSRTQVTRLTCGFTNRSGESGGRGSQPFEGRAWVPTLSWLWET
jgi:hypothetical protein